MSIRKSMVCRRQATLFLFSLLSLTAPAQSPGFLSLFMPPRNPFLTYEESRSRAPGSSPGQPSPSKVAGRVGSLNGSSGRLSRTDETREVPRKAE
ncbi:uncharacterized protein CC84DRAFT_389056 [Paraphaeosphaeria sporulosa]|uniref:Secreted protein n=1 Tax=Paraphaeosphaeria sporulosa TaxID=1460663 RepID=A0A177BX33_9PLEO|nr:uncharacterized protein CC84DRAFT_389056 [Paraphaeosphaeria sporulosa]OAF99251.1 hypothetical protein CC84DRAFT_389056 [Paraphaeosphaeria sporulosa]